MTSTAKAPVETSPGELNWELVHTEPGALVYALPGVNPPVQSGVRRTTGRADSEWAPAGTPGPDVEPSEHPALQYAEYLGWAGLLAAALGVGAAVASVPGIAWAEPTDSGSGTSSTSTSATSESTTTESDTSSRETAASSTATTSPTTVTSSAGGAQTSATTSGPLTSSAASAETSATVSAPGGDSPTAVVRSSGGARTSTSRRGARPAHEAAAHQPAAPADEEPVATGQTAGQEPTARLTTDTQAEQREERTPGPATATPEPGSHHRSETPAEPVQFPIRSATPDARKGASGGTASRDDERPDAARETLPMATSDTNAAAATPAPTPVTPAQSPTVNTQTALAMPSPAPVHVVTNLLGTLGLGPMGTITNSPAPAEPPAAWAVLDVARRQKPRAGTTAAAGPVPTSLVEDQAEPDGGALNRSLPLPNPADALTYRVAGGPAHGTVAIHPDGTFTYTPSAPGDDQAARLPDSFPVTVSDAHGNNTTVPVTLTTDPAATAPAMSLRVSDPGGTDAVHISVAPTDRFTDQLSHLVVHNPSYGTTVADSAAITQPDETVVDTIGVGGTPTHIAVSPDGTRAYITNTASKSVTVINTATNDVITTIPVGRTPTQVAVSADGTRTYVTNTASNTVSVIDTDPASTTYNTVVATVRVGWTPTQIVLSPDGSAAYVTNTASKSVSVISTSDNAVIKTIHVGWAPTQIAVSSNGSSAYVTNSASNTVSVIDTTNNTVVSTIRVGRTPTQIAVSPDGALAYVTNTGSNTVSVIDTNDNTVVATVGVGKTPTQVMVSPDGALAYVTNTGSNSVSVIDTATYTVVDTVAVGNSPFAMAIVSGGSLPVVTPPTDPVITDPTTGAATGSLGVVDPDGDPLTITFAEGGEPAYGTVTFDDVTGEYVYVPNQAARLRAGLGEEITDSFTVNITQSTSTTGGTQVYVVNTNSNTVSVIGAAPAPTTRAMAAAAAPAALAADEFSATVTITGIQIAPGEVAVTNEIHVSSLTTGVATSPKVTDHRAYVANGLDNSVSVINTETNTVVVPDIQLPGNPGPIGVAVSSDGTRVYVTNFTDRTVVVIRADTAQDSYEVVGEPILVGTDPTGVAVNADGTRVYVTNRGDNTVTMIDADTANDSYTVIDGPISVGTSPMGIAVGPDGTVYVANQGSDFVSMIDTSGPTPSVKSITVGLVPTGVTVDPVDGTVYVTTFRNVVVIDPTTPTPTIIANIGVGEHAQEVKLSPDRSLAFENNYYSGDVWVINTETNTVIGDPIPVGADPMAVAVTSEGAVYVTHFNFRPDNQPVTIISIVPTTPTP